VATVIHIQPLRSEIYIYIYTHTHIYSSHYRESGRAKLIKILGQQWTLLAKGILARAIGLTARLCRIVHQNWCRTCFETRVLMFPYINASVRVRIYKWKSFKSPGTRFHIFCYVGTYQNVILKRTVVIKPFSYKLYFEKSNAIADEKKNTYYTGQKTCEKHIWPSYINLTNHGKRRKSCRLKSIYKKST
jgi:hypothetical protein